MSCSYCYIPFDGVRVRADQAAEVVDVVMGWSPVSVTVGGGDPLMYPFTPQLLRRIRQNAADRPLFVQLDSNLVRPHRHDIAVLAHDVDMIGVPVDTFDAGIARQMRGNAGHPIQLSALIPKLVDEGLCVKMNTVVAAPNRGCLDRLAAFVSDSGVHAWSLYEFWAIGAAATRNNALFALAPDIFQEVVKAAKTQAAPVEVEAGTIASRSSAYFFVTPTGRAYTIDSGDSGQYAELGNVLTDEVGVLERWHRHADVTANEARVRSRVQWAHRSAVARTMAATPSHPRT